LTVISNIRTIMTRLFYTLLRMIRFGITRLRLWFSPSTRALFENIDSERIEISPVRNEDVVGLEKFLTSGDFMKHRKRLAGQEAGAGTYLIARGNVPAGHIYIIWKGCQEGPPAEREKREPLIEDFYVHPAARGKGIGRALLQRAEDLIRERGYHGAGVSVIVTNPPVEKMYKRAGYRDSGYGKFISRRTFTGRNGRTSQWSKKVSYLIKKLR